MVPVTLAAGLASLAVLFLVFRKSLAMPIQVQPMEQLQWNKSLSSIGLVFLGLSIVAMAIASYAGFEMWAAALAFALGCMGCAAVYLKHTGRDFSVLSHTLKKLPWALTPFLLSMFVLILALNQAGVTETLAHSLPDNPFAYGLASFAASNVINNIPMSVLFTSILGSCQATPAMVFAQERKIHICVGQVADHEVFISCDGDNNYPLRAGATAMVRLSDQVIQLVTFSKAEQFQAIDQKLRSRR